MQHGFKRILVAVRDIEGFSSATLRKVATLAHRSEATVELCHAITEPELIETVWRDRSGRPADIILQTIEFKTNSRLSRLARTGPLAHIRITVHSTWDNPAYEAIIRRALALQADLVVVEAPRYGPELRPFLRHTDWQLILHCPCPVLLIRSPGRYARSRVLVAVDPLHAADESADLDRRLLSAGKYLARMLRGDVHACHVYLPTVARTTSKSLRRERSPVDVESQSSESVRRRFERLASRSGVSPNHCHLVEGRVSIGLARVARKVRARILVMAALSRSSEIRDFIGSTAEQILEHVGSDVLVIKPSGFKTAVRPKVASRPKPPV